MSSEVQEDSAPAITEEAPEVDAESKVEDDETEKEEEAKKKEVLAQIDVSDDSETESLSGDESDKENETKLPEVVAKEGQTTTKMTVKIGLNTHEVDIVEEEIVDDLPRDLAIRAYIELGETKTKKEAAIQELREYAEKENFTLYKHYKEKGDEAERKFLLAFLRCKKYDFKRASKVLRKLDTISVANDYVGINIEEIQDLIDTGAFIMLPTLDIRYDCPIVFFKWNIVDFKRWSLANWLRGIMFALFELLSDENLQVTGVTYIEDMGDSDSSMYRDLDMKGIKTMLKVFSNALPGRMKGMYGTNIPGYLIQMMKPLMRLLNKKMRERIVFLKNNDKLAEIVGGKDRLHPLLGGTFDYSMSESWMTPRMKDLGLEYNMWSWIDLEKDYTDAAVEDLPDKFGMKIAVEGDRKFRIIPIEIHPGGFAESIGIKHRDLIWSVNDHAVIAARDLSMSKYITKKKKKRKIVVKVFRQDGAAEKYLEKKNASKDDS